MICIYMFKDMSSRLRVITDHITVKSKNYCHIDIAFFLTNLPFSMITTFLPQHLLEKSCPNHLITNILLDG